MAANPGQRWGRLAASAWRRALPALLGLLLGVPLLIVGVDLPTAGVSGFAEADFLRFEAAAPFTTADLRAVNLKMAGLASLELADGEVVTGEDLALSLSSTVDGERRTSIPAFEVGTGSQITLIVDREERSLNLAIEAERLHFDLIPPQGTRVQIDGTACPVGTCDFVYEGMPPLSVKAGGDTPFELRMDLETEPRILTDRVAVATVQLWELERLPGTVEKRGAVHQGSLRFLEAPEQAEHLPRGSVLDIDPASLVLRALEIRRHSVYLQFSGRVEEVSVYIGDAGHSLMPTRFDWLSRDPRVQVGLGIVSILLGGGLTLIRSLAQSSHTEGSSLVPPSPPENQAKLFQPEKPRPGDSTSGKSSSVRHQPQGDPIQKPLPQTPDAERS